MLAVALVAGTMLVGIYAFVTVTGERTGCPLAEASIGRFVPVDGGGFVKGATGAYPEEGPRRPIYVSPFFIQVNEVTNAQFAEFVAATGYLTDAERTGGSAQFDKTGTTDSWLSWWTLDEHATWKSPEGAGSTLEGKALHPVIHVSLNDARAYADWAGGRLPTEIEWEYAATLGLFDRDDPESGRRGPDGRPRANTWDGVFPAVNTQRDGYAKTAPVGCFAPSRIGAHDMIGNVWEWTDSPFQAAEPLFTIKGGSYLCSSDFCRRYRPAARQRLEPDFSTAHVGFRLVKDSQALH